MALVPESERWAGLEPASAGRRAGAASPRAGPPQPPPPRRHPRRAPLSRRPPPPRLAPQRRPSPRPGRNRPGLPVTPGRPDMHEPPQAAPRRRRTSSSGPPAAGPANPAGTGPVPPGEPPAASSLPPAGGTGRARPPESWVSPLWGAPVDLPEALELAPVADEAARRAVSASPAGPAAPPSGPGTAAPAGSRPGQRADDAGTSVARGAAGHREPGAGRATAPDRPRELTPVRDLMPPPASRTGPATMPGTEPGEPYREPRAPGRPYLSIGTIEVTVVPPAPPAAAGREAQPSPPVTPRLVPPSFPARVERGQGQAPGRAPPLVRNRAGLMGARDDVGLVRGDRLPDRAGQEPVGSSADLGRGRRRRGRADVHAELHRAGARRGTADSPAPS